MADIKYYDVILKPVITEKSMAGMGDKKYTFLVHTQANKSQIKEAVEKMFEGTKVARGRSCSSQRTARILRSSQAYKIRLLRRLQEFRLYTIKCDNK